MMKVKIGIALKGARRLARGDAIVERRAVTGRWRRCK